MLLNAVAEVDDGDEDFITPAQLTDSDGTPVIVQSDLSVSEKEAQDAARAMTGHELILQSIQDEVDRYYDLNEVAALVLGEESICVHRAEELLAIVPSLESALYPLSTFTKTPSKTNFTSTKLALESALVSAQTAVQSTLSGFIETHHSATIKLLALLQEEFLPAFLSLAQRLTEKAQADLPIIARSRNFLLYDKQQELTDLRKKALPWLAVHLEDGDNQLPPAMRACLPPKEVYHYFRLLTTSALTRIFLDLTKFDRVRKPTMYAAPPDLGKMDYNTLVGSLATGSIPSMIEQYIVDLDQTLAEFTEVSKVSDPLLTDVEKDSRRLDRLIEINQRVLALYSLYSTAMPFLTYVEMMMDAFRKIAALKDDTPAP